MKYPNAIITIDREQRLAEWLDRTSTSEVSDSGSATGAIFRLSLPRSHYNRCPLGKVFFYERECLEAGSALNILRATMTLVIECLKLIL